MSTDRYAILGLGRPRSTWLSQLSAWTTSGALPVELVKCVSGAEVRQKLRGLRPYSALIVDASLLPSVSDLVHEAGRLGLPTFAVGESEQGVNDAVVSTGVSAILPEQFTPPELLFNLMEHAQVIHLNAPTETVALEEHVALPWSGDLVAVCGSGGTGTSTAAIAIAQGLAAQAMDGGLVVLADFARNAEQAMLHDANDVVPSIDELIEAHRSGRPAPDQVRSLTFASEARRYRLLLGMRRPQAWATMTTRAITNAVEGLQRSFRTVVTDITGDFEGEAEGGSVDVEERNALARSAATAASIVVAVGSADMKGIHSLAKLISALIHLGVEPERILPVVNRAPRHGVARAEIASALSLLVRSGDGRVCAPIYIRDKKGLTAALSEGTMLPTAVVKPLTAAVCAMLQIVGVREDFTSDAEAIVPGSLGIAESAVGY